jgi:large subunit ribosomal protein L15
MKLNQIRDKHGSRQAPKRVGRGIGSGLGKTSGKGGKGQTARTGVALNGFEGGQTPLYRRLPKRGFNNHDFAPRYQELNLDVLQWGIDEGKVKTDAPITVASLVASGLLRRPFDGVRLLGRGSEEFKATVTVECAGASQSATAAIEKAGGKIVVLPRIRAGVVKDSEAKQAKRAAKRKAAEPAKKEAAPAEAKGEKPAKAEKPAKPPKPAKPAGDAKPA